MRDVAVILCLTARRAARQTAIVIFAASVCLTVALTATWNLDHRRVRDRVVEIVRIWIGSHDREVVTRFSAVDFPGGRVVSATEVRSDGTHRYCYVDRPDAARGIREVLTVGRRGSDGITWVSISDEQSKGFGLSAAALTALAQLVCRL